MKRRNGHGSPTPAGARRNADDAPTDEPGPPAQMEPVPDVQLRELPSDLSGESSDTLTLTIAVKQ